MPIPIASFDAVWVATGASPALWTTDANWSPANAPTDSENIRIPAGTAPINATGMTSNINYGSLFVERGYQYDLGTSAARVSGAFAQIVHYGNGVLYFDGTVGSGAGSTPLITVASGRGNALAANLDGTAFSVVKVLRGTVQLAQTMAALARLELGYITDPTSDAVVHALANSNALTKVVQRAGRLESSRLITLLQQLSGTCIQMEGQAVTEADVGGTLNYISGSTLVTCRVGERGHLDVTSGRGVAGAITTLDLAPNSRYSEDLRVAVTNIRDERSLSNARAA